MVIRDVVISFGCYSIHSCTNMRSAWRFDISELFRNYNPPIWGYRKVYLCASKAWQVVR